MYARSLLRAALAASLLSACSSADEPEQGQGTSGAQTGGDAGADASGPVRNPVPGAPEPTTPAVCGDGLLARSEACDDRNTSGGDGCSADCKLVEPAFDCAEPGSSCVDTSVCGDKEVSGREQCDDGNVSAGDGCTASCQIELGYQCRVPGAMCRAESCGDGLVAGLEECDDSNQTAGDGCDALCRVEPGFVCTNDAGCRPTQCGDGKVEGSEQCDDANQVPFDKCYACQSEPECANGACTAVCGDGIKFPGEACDDGNKRADDGCSASCTLEAGFACTLIARETPSKLSFPIVYRDFRGYDMPADATKVPALPRGHLDFENKNATEKEIVLESLGPDKKPQYAKEGRASISTHGKMWFDMWYNDAPGHNLTVADTIEFTRQADGGYLFHDDEFFPLDGRGFMAEGIAAEKPSRTGGHNFHFTSELRYWFEYKGGEKLDFLGDDDVWVFVNGRRAIDLGGVHGAQAGYVVLSEGTAAGLQSQSCQAEGGMQRCSDIRFGLEVGKIYEVVVFQAERHESKSQYKLTLRGFEKARSQCKSVCGDGIVTQEEVCDDGKNDGSYGSCMPGCQDFGPHCGDQKTQMEAGESCDDGNKRTNDGCDNACNATIFI